MASGSGPGAGENATDSGVKAIPRKAVLAAAVAIVVRVPVMVELGPELSISL